MTPNQPVDLKRAARLVGALIGLSVVMGACTHTDRSVTASIPDDYRQRHPIVIQETQRTVNIFVGSGRGGLTSSERADVFSLGQVWVSEGTGAIVVDVPTGTPNARAAGESSHEIMSLLAAAGVPAHGVKLHRYHPIDPREFATIRLNYPKISAVAGPCGLWPEDLGPSIKNKSYLENKEYWNFGCAAQRNLAAMVDNPADLVQPRSETPAYTARRTAAFEKYRKGTSTAVIYPEADKAKLSEVGK